MAAELTVSLPQAALPSLLADWQWLLEKPHVVLLVTAMGDAFVANEASEVLFLDTMEGSLTPVASSREAFFSLMNSGQYDPSWFNPDMVDLKATEPLAPGQCYSYRHPPCLGGSFDSTNVEPCDALVHFSIAGQLHRQIKDLPEGTRISGFCLDESSQPTEAPTTAETPPESHPRSIRTSVWKRVVGFLRSRPKHRRPVA